MSAISLYTACGFGLLMSLFGSSTAMALTSDLWLYLADDLASAQIQHTLISTDYTGELELPRNTRADVLHIALVQPGQSAPMTTRLTTDAARASIRPGTTVVQYQSSGALQVRKSEQGDFILAIKTPPAGVPLPQSDLDHVLITLVIPDSFEAVRLTSVDPAAGRWTQGHGRVRFEHQAAVPTTLAIALRARTPDENAVNCSPLQAQISDCDADRDADAAADVRDVCINRASTRATWHGCEPGNTIALPAVEFEPGDAYLSVDARDTLDRLAAALQHTPDKSITLVARADNGGPAEQQAVLARQRAEGARQDLLLKGIEPDRVAASGPATLAERDDLSQVDSLFMLEATP